MDNEGDSKVGHEEDLKSYIGCMGFKVNDEDVKVMIKLDRGHQNGVTF